MAVGAAGIGAVQFGALTQGQVGDRVLVLFFQGRNVRWSRRHVFPQHLFQHPHAASDGAGAVGKRGRRQNAGHPQNPAPVGIRQGHAAHVRSGDGFFQTVQGGKGFVEEGVIPVHKTQHALVLPHDAIKEQPGLMIHRLAHPGGHLREFDGVEGLALQVPQPKPLRPKSIKQSPGTGIRQQTPHLRLQHRRLVELPPIGQGGQLGIGHGCPHQI